MSASLCNERRVERVGVGELESDSTGAQSGMPDDDEAVSACRDEADLVLR
jgi:hypothetical protein